MTALEEVEIYGFKGREHEINFLKLIFECAPMLTRMIVKLTHEASASASTMDAQKYTTSSGPILLWNHVFYIINPDEYMF